jgi:hypothetical protein
MRHIAKLSTLSISALCLGIGAASVYAKGAKPDMTIVPAGTAKFAPADPKQPKGIQIAVLEGDPASGPVELYLKFPKGPVPLHWHSSDYSAIVVEGSWKHYLAGKDGDAKPLPVGSAWFQPGGSVKTVHGDECLADSCTLLIAVHGKFDMNVAKTDAKPATPPKK